MDVLSKKPQSVGFGPRYCQVCGNTKSPNSDRCRICGHDYSGPETQVTVRPEPAPTLPRFRLRTILITGFVIVLVLILWLRADPGVRWSTTIDSGARVTTAPLIAEGFVIFGDSLGRITALDIKNGQRKWVFQSTESEITGGLVAARGRVYAVADTVIHSLTLETGKEIWAHEDPQGFGTPCVAGSELLVGTGNSLRALSLATGDSLWQFDSPDGHLPQTPIAKGDVIYFGYTAPGEGVSGANGESIVPGGVYAVDLENANQLWVAGIKATRSAPLVRGDLVCGVDSKGLTCAAFALNRRTGDVLWEVQGPTTRLAIEDGRVYYARQYVTLRDQPKKGEYVALDLETGRKLWSRNFLGAPVSDPVIGDGLVFFGTADKVHALDAETGDVSWTVEVSEEVRMTPTLFDGTLYFTCGESTICALDID